MNHYVVVNEWVSDNKAFADIIGVAHSLDEAKEIFNKRIEEERAYAEENEYTIFEENDVYFDAGEDGYYFSHHTKLYIQMVTNRRF